MGSGSSVLVFPDKGLRAALAVLRSQDGTEVERQLALSVVVVAVERGEAVPTWAIQVASEVAERR